MIPTPDGAWSLYGCSLAALSGAILQTPALLRRRHWRWRLPRLWFSAPCHDFRVYVFGGTGPAGLEGVHKLYLVFNEAFGLAVLAATAKPTSVLQAGIQTSPQGPGVSFSSQLSMLAAPPPDSSLEWLLLVWTSQALSLCMGIFSGKDGLVNKCEL